MTLRELRRDFIRQLAHPVLQVIAAMTVGKDVSPLFPYVVNCMQVGPLPASWARLSVCGRGLPSLGCNAVPFTGKAVCCRLPVPVVPCCVQTRSCFLWACQNVCGNTSSSDTTISVLALSVQSQRCAHLYRLPATSLICLKAVHWWALCILKQLQRAAIEAAQHVLQRLSHPEPPVPGCQSVHAVDR